VTFAVEEVMKAQRASRESRVITLLFL